MCGIAGYLTSDNLPGSAAETVRRMTAAVAHRGPDADGLWLDNDSGIALGHRRLSILDLSPEGNQPMVSRSGRFVIVFNGEIYNYRDIKKEVEAGESLPWRGHSDTEVMLAAFEKWGVDEALKRFVGMFAFALWDRQERTLTIARDRIGEKPLYYGWRSGTFLFASELKALHGFPTFRGEIDPDSLSLFLRYGYIPGSNSIYRGISKLLPGTYLQVRVDQTDTAPTIYWSAHAMAEAGLASPFIGNDKEAIDQLELMLRASVREQMVADVPLGAFLSGGIDSSTIVAIMQSLSSSPVRTFTIGFYEQGYNEAEHAKEVAQYLGTDHTELYISPQQAIDVIPLLPHIYDEPFSDSSQIPTFLISELTRRQVTVSLSGDGGDELFCGYNKYQMCEQLWRKIGWIPDGVRQAASRTLRIFPSSMLDFVFAWLKPAWERYGRPGKPSLKLRALSDILSAPTPAELHTRLISHWKDLPEIVIGSNILTIGSIDTVKQLKRGSYIDMMMFLDLIGYLPDDILVKVDRAAMGVSLETRVPMLDHRIVEFAWSLPQKFKLHDGVSKWVLRQVLHKYLPKTLVERPKRGFAVPIDSWLRGPLRDWAEELLNEKRLKQEGFFNPAPIREKWQEHLSDTRNWQYHLWDVLMFQAWFEEEGKRSVV